MVNAMFKKTLVGMAALLSLGAAMAPAAASAYPHGGWGWRGGWGWGWRGPAIGGLIVGASLAHPYYGPPPVYYAGPGYWGYYGGCRTYWAWSPRWGRYVPIERCY